MSDDASIDNWRSILTLIVFLGTNVVVVFPFPITLAIPSFIARTTTKTLSACRITAPRGKSERADTDRAQAGPVRGPVRFTFQFDFMTAPLAAVLFLLAIRAIGRKEVKDGILGSDGIVPIDIMAFFITLAYVAISLDASGLVRFMAFWVLKKGGHIGHRLYLYLYLFFFVLGSFIGNDPIILSGTAFLAYLTRAASNIKNPRAWIHAQFAIANIASAILVSSNPTNLVLAGAFGLKFVTYTANMIVPVVVTVIVLFPFLLYIIFRSPDLIPYSITLHELPTRDHQQAEMNGEGEAPSPSVPRFKSFNERDRRDLEHQQQLPLEEVLDPYLEVQGAAFGGILFAVTLAVLLATNAAGVSPGVYSVTVPAAFVMFCRDVWWDWSQRGKRKAKKEKEKDAAEKASTVHPIEDPEIVEDDLGERGNMFAMQCRSAEDVTVRPLEVDKTDSHQELPVRKPSGERTATPPAMLAPQTLLQESPPALSNEKKLSGSTMVPPSRRSISPTPSGRSTTHDRRYPKGAVASPPTKEPRSLQSLGAQLSVLANEYFPTVCTVVRHLPFALIPFAFCMFILVQGLVTKGWVDLFAKGWQAWVHKVGVVGAIAGMGFVSVCLCNFCGTNIGATILLSRVLQVWIQAHHPSQRLHDATIYALALGVNYGAFSTTFSASLAGMLWRDILARKHIRVRRLDFANINVPIIAISMTVGCLVLVAQVFIAKKG